MSVNELGDGGGGSNVSMKYVNKIGDKGGRPGGRR